MGYTHYWYQKPSLNAAAFAEFGKDVEKIIRAAGVKLQYEFDDAAPPTIGHERIVFNGVGDEGHETFHFQREAESRPRAGGTNEAFTFCKTAQKPYDIVVCAVLIAAKKHFGDDLKVSSDGDQNDWADAFELADRLLGYTATINADDRELEVS